jgi:tape measure domain-containing protein
MVGRVVLDKSGYSTPLRAVVNEAKTAQPEIAQALANPLRQATTAGVGLTNEMGSLRRAVSLSAVAGAGLGVALTSGFQMALGSLRSLVGMFSDFAVSGLKSAAAYEATLLSFETMLGSAEKAAQLMADIKKFAAETPFELPTLSDATKKLLAYGVAQENIIGTLRRLGDISAATEKPLGDLADIYGKVLSKGKMQAEEMNQFIERGVPIAKVLADAYGRSTEEIMQMAGEGKIGFAQLEFALQRLTDKGGMFGGGMEKLSKGLSGLWSTLSDEWSDAQRQFGQAINEGVNGKSMLSQLTQQISEMKPAIVDAAVAATAALNGLMPMIRAAAEGLDNIRWLLSDAEQSVSKGALELPMVVDRAKAGGVGTSGNVDQIAAGYQKAAEDLRTGLSGLSEASVVGFDAVGAKQARQWMQDTLDAAGQIQRIRAEVAAAAAANDEESYKRGLDALAEQINRIEAMKAGLNDIASRSNVQGNDWLAKLVDQARLSTNAGTRQARDAWTALLREPASDVASPPSPTPTPASSSTPPPMLGDDKAEKAKATKKADTLRDMVQQMTREAEIIRAQSEGRIADAEKLRLKEWFDGERAKIATLQERIALEVLAAAKLAKIEQDEAERKKAVKEKQDAEAERERDKQLQEEKRVAAERERLYQQLVQRARGDLGELDQLSAADRAAAYASQSRLITYGPHVSSALDQHLGSPMQPARGPGAESSPARAATDAIAPLVEKMDRRIEKIEENVNELTRVTIRNIERNTDKLGETKVVRF